jgi:hypothetical protein
MMSGSSQVLVFEFLLTAPKHALLIKSTAASADASLGNVGSTIPGRDSLGPLERGVSEVENSREVEDSQVGDEAVLVQTDTQ